MSSRRLNWEWHMWHEPRMPAVRAWHYAEKLRLHLRCFMMIDRDCYDPTPPVFENEGYACRTRPKLRQPIYCTGSYIVTMWSVSQYSYCGFESWLCSELSAKQYVAVKPVTEINRDGWAMVEQWLRRNSLHVCNKFFFPLFLALSQPINWFYSW